MPSRSLAPPVAPSQFLIFTYAQSALGGASFKTLNTNQMDGRVWGFSMVTANPIVALKVTQTYGALPSTFPAGAGGQSESNLLAMRLILSGVTE
jgi:hypothetical protein